MTRHFPVFVAMVVLGVVCVAGCAARKSESEREWARAECRQIIDAEARGKCIERVDKE